jgi:large-conductance mechanosensitive channel
VEDLDMTLGNPYRTGGALAITVAIGYALCSIVFWLFPEASANFMNALFHGLDFRPLKRDATFTFASFGYGFTVLVVWAFLMGAVFGWIAERLLGLGEAAVAVKPRLIP